MDIYKLAVGAGRHPCGPIRQGTGSRSAQALRSVLSNQVREAFPVVFEPRESRVECRDPESCCPRHLAFIGAPRPPARLLKRN
jgi:hypothetical protein